ncbi:MAG: 6-bladed beta-propeller [Mangrovibacterium sp.]
MNKEYKTISFDLKSEKDDLKIKIESVIKLETSDNSLVGEITKITFFEDRFFVLDRMISKTLFVFDKSGKFIAKTKRGKGPGECIDPWDFMIDSVNHKIQLWDQANYKMIEYDLHLNLIKADYFEGVSLVNAESMNNDTLIVFAQVSENFTAKNNNSYFNYCIYANVLNKPIKKLLPTTKELIGLTLESPICKTNRIILVAPFDNAIYGIDKLQAKVLYYLDFGKLNITNDDIAKGISYVFHCSKNGSRITSIDDLHENSQYLSFSFFHKNRINFFIHSKGTNNNYYSERIFQERKLPRCILKGIKTDGSFLAVSTPSEIRDFELTGINNNMPNNINDQDNSYIIIFDIKES